MCNQAHAMFFSFRKILTAAHCVCIYRDDTDPNTQDRVKRYCLPNVPGQAPVNQQSAKDPPTNYLVVRAGGNKEKDITKMKQVHVRFAFVMQTFQGPADTMLGNGFDIGLIVPTDEGRQIMRKLDARPLFLPAM